MYPTKKEDDLSGYWVRGKEQTKLDLKQPEPKPKTSIWFRFRFNRKPKIDIWFRLRQGRNRNWENGVRFRPNRNRISAENFGFPFCAATSTPINRHQIQFECSHDPEPSTHKILSHLCSRSCLIWIVIYAFLSSLIALLSLDFHYLISAEIFG